MTFFDTTKQRAAILIVLLGIGIALALTPYVSGLIGAPVLYVLFAPLQKLLVRRIRPSIAAGIVILVAFMVIILPGTWLISLIVGQAQQAASEVVDSPLLDRLSTLRIGRYELGPQIAQIGRELVGWLGGGALGFIGTATRFTLNVLLAFFGMYFILVNPEAIWKGVRPYIPFSRPSVEILRDRFVSVTIATVVGTGLVALIQGTLVGLGFALTGLSNPMFWGVVTMIFAVLPIVGSGLVWGPGALSLFLADRPTAAIVLIVLGIVVVGNIENLIRPIVFRRYSQIHPMVTLVGAIAGVSYFGLLGLLIGPLALSYFFEVIRMYRVEYLGDYHPLITSPSAETATPPPAPTE
jgi:predicted PurR-regulated permease PerM